MKNTIILIALVFSLFSSPNVYGQSTVKILEDVVLFNDQAYVVKMTPKGKIIEFVKDLEKNYSQLNKYEASSSEMAEADAIAAIDLGRKGGNTLDLAAYVAAKGDVNTKPEKVVKVKAVEAKGDESNLAIATPDVSVNKDEEILTKGIPTTDTEEESGPTTTNYAYEFAFDHRDASLSPSSVRQLDEIAKIMKGDIGTEININSYFSESVDISRVLSKNRTKGIHDMLVSKGISSSRIKIQESNNEDWSNNRVKVSIH